MVEQDVDFIKRCLGANLIQSPCLELGVGYGGPNNKRLIQDAGIKYVGTDLVANESVDVCVNFEDSPETVEAVLGHAKYGSVLVLNVLEHTFDPIRVLDKMLRSRVIHKIFNTVGRGMRFPSCVATGVVITKDVVQQNANQGV